MAHPSIQRAKTIARLMDSAWTIPVIRKKVGLDPILGLLPVGGDIIAMLISLYILWVAYDLRLPKSVLARMSVNILLDACIGAIPLIGDYADIFWKSNMRNVQLLEEAYLQYGKPEEIILDVQAEPA